MNMTDVATSDTEPLPTPPRALRVLQVFLWVSAGFLAIISAVTAFVVIRALFGDAPLYAQGSTGDVLIEHVTPAGEVLLQRPTEAATQGRSPRFLDAGVQVQLSSPGPKIVKGLEQLVVFSFAWFGLLQLLRVVRTSLRGAPFSQLNARRLERLGWAAVLFPLLSWFIGRSVMATAIDSEDVGVTGFLPRAIGGFSPSWFAIGLLLIGLGWVFRWGAELVEFEASVI